VTHGAAGAGVVHEMGQALTGEPPVPREATAAPVCVESLEMHRTRALLRPREPWWGAHPERAQDAREMRVEARALVRRCGEGRRYRGAVKRNDGGWSHVLRIHERRGRAAALRGDAHLRRGDLELDGLGDVRPVEANA
jgi:hypothetical protein